MQRSGRIGMIVVAVVVASAGVASVQQKSRASAPDRAMPNDSSEAVATSAPAGTRRVEVMDPMFGQLAYTVTIPADWVFQGTLLRTHFGPSPVFRASSPDGLTGVQMLPRYDWVATNDPGMRRFYADLRTVMGPPMPAADVITKYVLPEARPGVQVVGPKAVQFLAQLAERDRTMNAEFDAQAARTGQPARHVTSDAAAVRLRYDFNGRPVEEVLLANTQLGIIPTGRGTAQQLSQATIMTARAPAGRYEATEKTLGTILGSMVVDPAWQTRQNAFALQSAQDKQRQILTNAQQRLAQNKAIFDASMQRTAGMEAARHAGAVATADHMGDVQLMVDPATGRTGKVSNQSNYSYVDQNGTVVHTNSATYNPNAELRGNWTQLQPMKP